MCAHYLSAESGSERLKVGGLERCRGRGTPRRPAAATGSGENDSVRLWERCRLDAAAILALSLAAARNQFAGKCQSCMVDNFESGVWQPADENITHSSDSYHGSTDARAKL